VIKDPRVAGDVLGFFDVQTARGGVEVDGVGVASAKAEDHERSFQTSVFASGVRKHLDGDVGLLRDVDQPPDLGVHDRGAADAAREHGFIDHDPERDRGILV
jgi:hypothetical protein